MDSTTRLASRVRLALNGAEAPILVETNQQLANAAEKWSSSVVLGLDTEFVRERTYRADLGLVQISDAESAWLIDPLSVTEPAPLRSVLHDKTTVKVIHSGTEDMEVLWHQLNAKPENVVDSQIACAMLGQSLQLGYHHAVKWLFDIDIDKDQTRSNWLKRPLTAHQERYAALDVVLLPLVYELLKQQLEDLGRWHWLTEDVERMVRSSLLTAPTEEAWQRIRGAGSLDSDGRKVLSTLARWREEKAQQKNLARGFVVSDAGLMAMAKARPTDLKGLETLEDLHPKSLIRYGVTWLELIEEASTAPEIESLPQLEFRHKKLMKDLKNRVAKTAADLNVDAALLASRKQLERLVFDFEASGQVPDRFSGWRQDVITKDLLEILENQ